MNHLSKNLFAINFRFVKISICAELFIELFLLLSDLLIYKIMLRWIEVDQLTLKWTVLSNYFNVLLRAMFLVHCS